MEVGTAEGDADGDSFALASVGDDNEVHSCYCHCDNSVQKGTLTIVPLIVSEHWRRIPRSFSKILRNLRYKMDCVVRFQYLYKISIVGKQSLQIGPHPPTHPPTSYRDLISKGWGRGGRTLS